MANLKKTNFVVCSCASQIEDGMCLDEIWLLGWDNRTDWFDTDIDSCDILTENGNVKKNQFGLIFVDRHTAAYVGETQHDCQSHCDSANREGYDCCVCRIEKDETGDLVVYKI